MFTRPKEIAPLQMARAMACTVPGARRQPSSRTTSRVHVLAQALERRRPQRAGAGPLRELHHARPAAAPRRCVPFGGWRPSNGESSRAQRLELAHEQRQRGLGEAACPPCRRTAARRPRRARPPPARPSVSPRPPSPGSQPPITTSCEGRFLTLIQARRAPARLVRRVQPLGHDALEALRRARPPAAPRRRPRGARASRQLGPVQLELGQQPAAVGVGQRQRRVALQPQQVEGHVGHRHVAHPPPDRRVRGQVHARLEQLEARAARRRRTPRPRRRGSAGASPARRPSRAPPGSAA